MSEQNVDLFTRGIMIYENMLATFKVGLGVKTEGAMVISGTEGCLYVKAPWWKPIEIEIKRENQYNNEIIKYYLQKYNNDVKLVSQKLDIGRSTIYKLNQTRELVL